ncbi:3'-5' exonuclease [Marinobacterium sp. YM272]|uniref:3'-5' exonuclease n=1 Tax=Marinobacterium sp. YM272 TaxID=3421654 RepID=UPI003D7FE64A
MGLICVDIEASGLGPDSYPIEVAWRCELTGDQDSFLIDPASVEGWVYWDDFAEELHGIEPELLARQGVSAEVACERLNRLLAGKTLTCDAYDFDLFWLTRLFESQGETMTFSVQGIERFLTTEQCAEYRQRTQYRRHRALSDVEDQMAALRQLLKEVA